MEAATVNAGNVIAEKYRLIRELGRGGMGAVWEAEHLTLGRNVAVKFLTPQQKDSTLAERFVSEARTVAKIKHRFVIDVFDFGITGEGLYYMVLELLEGEELSEHMDGGPAFTVREGVRLIADCLKGLDAVHAAGIVHRDLKPENVFIVHDGDGLCPKLIDFGISRRARGEDDKAQPKKIDGRGSRLTEPGMLVGTPWYMSPEQLRGRDHIDARADVYSIGVILYELLAGRLPFDDENVAELVVSIVTRKPPTLADLRPELGPAISQIVERALAVEPGDRYPNALALRDALMGVIPALPEGAMTALQKGQPERAYGQYTEIQMQRAANPFSGGTAVTQGKPRTRLIAAVVASLIVLAALAIWLGGRSQPAAAPSQPESASTPAAPVAPQPSAAALPVPAEPAASPEPAAAPAAAAGPAVVPGVSDPATSAKAPAAGTAGTARPKPASASGTATRPATTPAKPKASPRKKLYHQLDF